MFEDLVNGGYLELPSIESPRYRGLWRHDDDAVIDMIAAIHLPRRQPPRARYVRRRHVRRNCAASHAQHLPSIESAQHGCKEGKSVADARERVNPVSSQISSEATLKPDCMSQLQSSVQLPKPPPIDAIALQTPHLIWRVAQSLPTTDRSHSPQSCRQRPFAGPRDDWLYSSTRAERMQERLDAVSRRLRKSLPVSQHLKDMPTSSPSHRSIPPRPQEKMESLPAEVHKPDLAPPADRRFSLLKSTASRPMVRATPRGVSSASDDSKVPSTETASSRGSGRRRRSSRSGRAFTVDATINESENEDDASMPSKAGQYSKSVVSSISEHRSPSCRRSASKTSSVSIDDSLQESPKMKVAVARRGCRYASNGSGGSSGTQEFDFCLHYARLYKTPIERIKIKHKEFLELDINSDGCLSRDEFANAIRRHCNIASDQPVPEQLLYVSWESADQDESGSLDFEEYLMWSLTHEFSEQWMVVDEAERELRNIARENSFSVIQVEKVKVVFDHYDKSGDGVIDDKEFRCCLLELLGAKNPRDVSENLVQRYWKEVDTDMNGTICFAEFVVWYLTFVRPPSM